MKDYKFRLLAYLYKHYPQTVNIRPLIDDFVKEGFHSTTYFGTYLGKWRGEPNHFIWCSDLISLSYRQAPQDTPILARLEPAGQDEYFRLRTQYNSSKKSPMSESEEIELAILNFLNENPKSNLSLEGIVNEIFDNMILRDRI